MPKPLVDGRDTAIVCKLEVGKHRLHLGPHRAHIKVPNLGRIDYRWVNHRKPLQPPVITLPANALALRLHDVTVEREVT